MYEKRLNYDPAGLRVQRRLVLLRSLVYPVSDRYLYSWRRAGGLLRCPPRRLRSGTRSRST